LGPIRVERVNFAALLRAACRSGTAPGLVGRPGLGEPAAMRKISIEYCVR
jgi:hypothetical protein